MIYFNAFLEKSSLETGWSLGEIGSLAVGEIHADENRWRRKLQKIERRKEGGDLSRLARTDFYCALFFPAKKDYALDQPQQGRRDSCSGHVQVGIQHLKRIGLSHHHQSLERDEERASEGRRVDHCS